MARLRTLGNALTTEITSQNEVIENITVKSDKANVVIRDQDKQMKALIGADGKKKPTDGQGALADVGSSVGSKFGAVKTMYQIGKFTS